eukprot:1138550-Prymnesium_polylepis.1
MAHRKIAGARSEAPEAGAGARRRTDRRRDAFSDFAISRGACAVLACCPLSGAVGLQRRVDPGQDPFCVRSRLLTACRLLACLCSAFVVIP